MSIFCVIGNPNTVIVLVMATDPPFLLPCQRESWAVERCGAVLAP